MFGFRHDRLDFHDAGPRDWPPLRPLKPRREHSGQHERLGPRRISNPPSKRVRFSVFEADLRSGELFRQGHKVKLRQQAFQVLALLLEHPGDLVTRDEMRQRLWPSDIFVDFDLGLNSAIKRVRDALEDSSEAPRFVETLPKRGYRFIAPLEPPELATNVKLEKAPSTPEHPTQMSESAHWQEQIRSHLIRIEQLLERQAQRQRHIVDVLSRLERDRIAFASRGRFDALIAEADAEARGTGEPGETLEPAESVP